MFRSTPSGPKNSASQTGPKDVLDGFFRYITLNCHHLFRIIDWRKAGQISEEEFSILFIEW
jgi:hypothetical protein